MQPPLPPRLKRLLFFVNLGGVNTNKPLNETRWVTNLFMKVMNWYGGYKFPNFYSVRDTSFTAAEGHAIKLKVFNPIKTEHKLPVWIYLHGGGFCHGGYDTRNNFCKAIATRVNCVVVSVEYRMAPEHTFPAAPHDCYEALQWIYNNAESFGGDKSRLAVGGESAGGNLSAVLALMARDKDGPLLKHQTLLYPTVDVHMNFPSIDKYASGYMLTKTLMQSFRDAYVPDKKDWDSPYLSPLKADLKNLAPALVVTAGYDPLCDEGKLYAEKLKLANVPVVHKHYDNMIHDFTMVLTSKLPEARDSVDRIVEEVSKAFNP